MSESYQVGQGSGPLRGLRVIEIAGIGPGPHAATILADLGADVVRVARPGGALALTAPEHDLLTRGRPTLTLDLKDPSAVETVLRLAETADVLIEGMRPGATERLGLGPDDVRARNRRLVYGRMTGWGQSGSLAQSAGHDMDYLAITGLLFGLGQDPARPHFPANLLGDFGGGSTYLVIGVLAAVLEARLSGEGQVVDAAIVDGVAHLGLMTSAQAAGGHYRHERAANPLEGGLPYYDLYETADGRHLAVGPLEAKFFAEMTRVLGLPDDAPGQADLDRYPELRDLIAAAVSGRTLAEWIPLVEGTDACVAPVLTLAEAAEHPHLVERGTYVRADGMVQPAPAPRFSRTPGAIAGAPANGIDVETVLSLWCDPQR